MAIKSGFTVSSQSGLCRSAYGKTYGFPTLDLQEAKKDAQRTANTLGQPVNLLRNHPLQVLCRFVPVAAE